MAESRIRRVVSIVATLLVVLLVAGGALWLFGPREPENYSIRFDASAIGDDPDAYLSRSEADVPNLRPDAAKEIVWAYPASHARTPIAIVYIHGFSASRNELRPLPDLVAKRLGANLFFTRLSGHGRDADAMAQASVDDWMNDYAEAMAIGRRLGDRVIVIGNSTGATLEAIAAGDSQLMRDTAGLVMIAPNFGVASRWAFVLDMPFARDFAPMLFGEQWPEDAADLAAASIWTGRYPSVALLTMSAAVRAAWKSSLDAAVPALFIYSPNDQTVNAERTREFVARWPKAKEVEEFTGSADPHQHILAGDAISAGTTQVLADRISAWIEALPKT